MNKKNIRVKGRTVAVIATNTIIVGAGAAGMNCAVQLVRCWRHKGIADPAGKLLIVTGQLDQGASRLSGSDKQTYYKMGTSPRVSDTAEDFAKTLTAFGCCHGDHALIEGIGSLRGFYNLVDAGVPFPHDPFGAFIGYKTDHDPYERATSAGPKTSRFMSHCLQQEATRMGVQIIDEHPVVKFITAGAAEDRRIVAMVCIDRRRLGEQDLGLTVFVAENWVLAGGGPGNIYQTTVYPRGQIGLHGPALEAGLEACNLTESQFGLASIKFRWNVSGTYMQVVPRIFSTDADGRDEREFLTEYFDDMPTMASNIFLKGYQWPFDAGRIVDHQSSLIDMAVHQETVIRGRRVWMDFLRNPVGKAGWAAFDINAMSPEAMDYLQKTGALQATPIERLEHMNPPAIAIYTENGIDLRSEPLEIAVCAQHNNGGFAVDKWWQSNLRHTFVIGEMAGTHGVKRPGGSALNAGQVGAMRAAQYIAGAYDSNVPDVAAVAAALKDEVKEVAAWLDDLLDRSQEAPQSIQQAMDQVGRRMTRHGAHIRASGPATEAFQEAAVQYAGLMEKGIAFERIDELPDAVAAIWQCLTHAAFLKAICGLFERGAGSRGSHCILDDGGVEMHPKLVDPASGQPYRFLEENKTLREQMLCLKYKPQSAEMFELRDETPRLVPDRQIAFEPAWSEFRDGSIFWA